MLRRRTLLAGTAALACGPAPSAPRKLAETRDVVAGLIRLWQDKLPVVGLSVALVDDGELAWVEGFGSADREAHRPATADTVYAIGSLTKPLTGSYHDVWMELHEDLLLTLGLAREDAPATR